MHLAVRGKNFEVTAALREYAEKKVGKIERLLGQPMNAQVNMHVERGRHLIEITASINGIILRGEESSTDMYASIDLVAEKLEKQVTKYKTRLKRQRSKDAELHEEMVAEEAPGDETPGDETVVKSKQFPVKPLTLDEAVMQMNLLSHDFFVFRNAQMNQINVVYRRKDGRYGLLEPEH